MFILIVAGIGALWTLTFMLIDAIRSGHDTRLLAEVELGLEIAQRTAVPVRARWIALLRKNRSY